MYCQGRANKLKIYECMPEAKYEQLVRFLKTLDEGDCTLRIVDYVVKKYDQEFILDNRSSYYLVKPRIYHLEVAEHLIALIVFHPEFTQYMDHRYIRDKRRKLAVVQSLKDDFEEVYEAENISRKFGDAAISYCKFLVNASSADRKFATEDTLKHFQEQKDAYTFGKKTLDIGGTTVRTHTQLMYDIFTIIDNTLPLFKTKIFNFEFREGEGKYDKNVPIFDMTNHNIIYTNKKNKQKTRVFMDTELKKTLQEYINMLPDQKYVFVKPKARHKKYKTYNALKTDMTTFQRKK